MGGIPDLLLGSNGNILQCLFCTRSGPDGIVHAYRLPNMNSFVQDDWKVNNKLTLNLGVRWEYDGTLSDKYGNLTNPQLQYMVPNSQVPSAPLGTAANYGGWVVPSNYQFSTWGPTTSWRGAEQEQPADPQPSAVQQLRTAGWIRLSGHQQACDPWRRGNLSTIAWEQTVSYILWNREIPTR